MKRYGRIAFQLIVAAMVIGAFSACSPRKNNAATRKYQAFITRYNIYYNGDTHYKETLKNMEEAYEDDYSSAFLPIHPVVAKQNPKAPQPSGNFDRSIEKAQKAIQLRSIKKKPKKQAGKQSDPTYKEWMKRDEYNPFLHNAWMMMGRSQYYNGDFLGAASTFFYISRHFSWLPQTTTEAKLWQARSYLAMDWLFEAETILRRIKPEADLTNGELKSLYYTAQADLLIKEQEWAKAADALRQAIPHVSKQQKIRLNFLLGQIYSRAGNKAAAYKAFASAGGSSAANYRTKFNARIKQSEVFEGDDISKEVGALKRMTRYDRNKQYLDQIYYAIGNLYLSRRDTTAAIENYELAVEKSTRSGIDKAMAQLTLGALYYDRHQYAKAQPCYSQAVPVIPDNYPNYAALKRRSDVLDELAVYSQNVELNDSLLRLAAMTPAEQLKVVNKIIEELKEKEKKDKEAADREEFMANRDQNNLTDQSSQNFTMNTGDDSWYFYNDATKNAGKTEFQRRWGNRKLEDDWRRRNKQTFSFNDFGGDENADSADGDDGEGTATPADSVPKVDPETLKKENDPHFPEYYLKQIPKTDMEKQTCNDVIQEGLYNMGVILKDKMEDFPAAEDEFEELLRRYPDNIYRLDAYYNMYLMFMRAGNLTKAEYYRQLILSEFPDTKYGIALQDPDYIGSLRRMMAMEGELYDEALDAYLDNRNRQVHEIYQKVSTDFPLSKLMPKFMFLEALTFVTDHKPEEFKQTLMEMLERYPNTDLTPYASSYLKGLAQGRQLQQGGTNMRGMLWDIRLGNDSVASDTARIDFSLNPNQKQMLILLFPTDEINQNALLFEVARHNFSSFVVKDFDLEQMNFGRLGLLIIKGFANVSEINHYLRVLNASPSLQLPPQVRPVVISEDNFEKLMRSGGSFEEYFNYMRDKTYDDTQERVLPSEFFEHEPAPAEAQEPEADASGTESKNTEPPTDNADNAAAEAPTEAPAAGETSTEAPADNADNAGETSTEAPTGSVGEGSVPGATAPGEEPTAPGEEPTAPGEEPAAPGEEPAAPAPAPAPGPAPVPTAPAPAPGPAPGPAPVPTAPAPAVKPELPAYPEGSEGDDPLLD